MDSNKYTHKSFGEALAGLLQEYQHNPYRANLLAFSDELEGYSYAALRLAAMGKVTVRPELMEAVARRLKIEPNYFKEYRVWQILQEMEAHPRLEELVYETVMSESETLAALAASAHSAESQVEKLASESGKTRRPKPQSEGSR